MRQQLRQSRTTSFSVIRESMDVTEIGLRSETDWIVLVFGTGVMMAVEEVVTQCGKNCKCLHNMHVI